MEKKFEEMAQKVRDTIAAYEKAVQEADAAVKASMGNENLSAIGKQNARNTILEKLKRDADTHTAEIRATAQEFCNTFNVQLPDDGKDHSMEINIAMTAIATLGFAMTTDVLRGILEPLKNSPASLKIVHDVMDAKNGGEKPTPGASYSPEVVKMLSQYYNADAKISDSIELFDNIEGVADESGARLDYFDTGLSVSPNVPYTILACADWMIEAATQYAALKTTNAI